MSSLIWHGQEKHQPHLFQTPGIKPITYWFLLNLTCNDVIHLSVWVNWQTSWRITQPKAIRFRLRPCHKSCYWGEETSERIEREWSIRPIWMVGGWVSLQMYSPGHLNHSKSFNSDQWSHLWHSHTNDWYATPFKKVLCHPDFEMCLNSGPFLLSLRFTDNNPLSLI